MIALVLAILFFCAFLYKVRDVWRAPRNLGAWAVLTLLAALTVVSLIRDGVPFVFGEYGTADLGILIRNLALVIGFGGLQLWHLHYCQVQASIRRARIEAGVLLAVVITLCAIAAALPDDVGLASTNQNLQSLSVQLFYRVAGVYTWYALGCQLVWNVRAARLFKQRWLRVAVLLTAAGDLFLIGAQINRALGQTIVFFTAGDTPLVLDRGETVFIVLGMPPLLIGLLFPPIVGAARRLVAGFRQVGRYRDLRSLHDAIRWAYPGMIRPDAPGNGEIASPRVPRTPRQLRFAYEERIQQCRDGYSRGRSEALDGRDSRPQRLGRTLRTLSTTTEAGDLSDEHQETQHLVAVSLALRDYGEAWKSHPLQPVADPQPAD